MDLALEACGLSHRFGKLADRQIHAGAHIEELLIFRTRLPVLQRNHAGLAKIIHMQELPQGGAAAPAGHAGVATLRRFVEAADQCRQYVAVSGVVVVTRPIQIGGHQADGIKAVLQPQRLAELDASDLGDRIPLIGGLQGAREERILSDRLLGELGVDAAAAEKQQPPHAAAPGRFNHMGLDIEVLQQKVGRVAAVGRNPTHLGGRQHHHRGLLLGKPTLHRCGIEQI